jgi:glycosyltransferase involved in cell wall biosynthesis
MKRLNIAMVAACPFPDNRGTPSRILRMAEGLSRLGHNIHVVTYHFGKDIKTTGIEIHRIPRVTSYANYSAGPTITKLLLLDPLVFFKLRKIIDKKNIDLIHAHHYEGALISYAAKLTKKVKVIYDAHTTLSGELPSYRFWNIKWIGRFLDRFVPRQADYTIAVSDQIKNNVLDMGVPGEKISVIPTGVNHSDFIKANPDRVGKKYNLGSRKVIIYTGSLEEFQDVQFLLEAMLHVRKKINEALLLVVGNDKSGKYSEITRELGIQDNVCFVGEKPFSMIPDFLSCADVAVLSRVNCPGIPQKLTNYMMAGKAIVSFQGSAELLSHGKNGLVVQNGNIEKMADSIIMLLQNAELRKRLGENARYTAIEKFDWDVLSKKLESIYASLLEH